MKIVIHLTVLLLLISMISISGCINNTQTNSTWGEKKISLDTIKISDNTTDYRSETNQSRYYVYGYIKNNNPIDAVNPKIKVTTYYSNGTVFAVNDTPYLEPENLPANGESYFYTRFYDPDSKITKFTVDIVDAKAEYWS
ncbi:MAG: hypothetical protein ABFC34_02255 [Methanobacterium sp.]